MFHILLFILKIIGMILGGILGILILLTLLVLLVPLRYRSEGSYYGRPAFRVVVSWLFHLFHVCVRYDENGFTFELRIFGRKMFQKKEKKRKAIRRAKKESKKTAVKTAEETKLISKPAEPVQKPEETVKPSKPKVLPKEEVLPVEEKPSGLKRILLLIKGFIAKIKNTIKNIYVKLKGIRRSLRSFMEFLGNEENKEAFRLIKGQFFVILKHIKPRNFWLKLHFGFDDPANTGVVLGMLSVLYPIYQKNVSLIPEFENQIFEGEYKMRGRVRGIRILIVGIRLFRHKPSRKLFLRLMA